MLQFCYENHEEAVWQQGFAREVAAGVVAVADGALSEATQRQGSDREISAILGLHREDDSEVGAHGHEGHRRRRDFRLPHDCAEGLLGVLQEVGQQSKHRHPEGGSARRPRHAARFFQNLRMDAVERGRRAAYRLR